MTSRTPTTNTSTRAGKHCGGWGRTVRHLTTEIDDRSALPCSGGVRTGKHMVAGTDADLVQMPPVSVLRHKSRFTKA
jgi:hypothetical protein